MTSTYFRLFALLPLLSCYNLSAAPTTQPAASRTSVNPATSNSTELPGKPRLLVLTDIGGDPDDRQSMVRLMVYCNEFDIEGLIASAAGTPGELKEHVTNPQYIREIIEAYGKVRDNLARHAAGYPAAEELLGRTKSGNPERGLAAIGDGHDTEGSNWIIASADKPDPRPLNITIWGGQTDLAQALWRVRHDRGLDGLQQFIAKLRVYDIADQDRIQPWIFENFPDLFYILNKSRDKEDRRTAAFRGMYLGGDESLTSGKWIEDHVRAGHGPLGALYPPKASTAPNPNGAMKEGDSPSWLYFLPIGPGDAAHPDWGGWGGRFVHEKAGLWRDAKDSVEDTTDAPATVWRWRPAFQNDFAARMDWCVQPPEHANHAPVAAFAGDVGRGLVVPLQARPGETVDLNAQGSSDPDGDRLTFRWSAYRETGTCPAEPTLTGSDQPRATVTVPATAEIGQTIHVILSVTDDRSPPLTAYRRIVITVGEARPR